MGWFSKKTPDPDPVPLPRDTFPIATHKAPKSCQWCNGGGGESLITVGSHGRQPQYPGKPCPKCGGC